MGGSMERLNEWFGVCYKSADPWDKSNQPVGVIMMGWPESCFGGPEGGQPRVHSEQFVAELEGRLANVSLKQKHADGCPEEATILGQTDSGQQHVEECFDCGSSTNSMASKEFRTPFTAPPSTPA